MDKAEQIRQKLKKMASEAGPDVTLLAQVKSVDEASLTCDLYDDDSGLDFTDVRLQPVIDGNKSVVLIPKANTWALAVRVEDSDDWMVIACGEVDKWLLKCDQTIINDGLNGGLVNWPDAKEQLDKTNEVVSAIVSAITTWVPVPNDGGAAFKTALDAALIGKAVGMFEGLEDNKVKH